MAWIKKSQSSLYRRHTGQELCLTVNLQGIPKHKSTSLRQAITIIKSHCLFRLSFHVVGKRVCLVMLWPNPARRDKPWNYIPLEFQRYTKLILATENLYGHVENAWGIPFPKKKKWKECFLGEIFQESVFWLEMTTDSLQVHWPQVDCNWLQTWWWLTTHNDYKVDWLTNLTLSWLQIDWLQMTTS
jgi:hypothetical protein